MDQHTLLPADQLTPCHLTRLQFRVLPLALGNEPLPTPPPLSCLILRQALLSPSAPLQVFVSRFAATAVCGESDSGNHTPCEILPSARPTWSAAYE